MSHNIECRHKMADCNCEALELCAEVERLRLEALDREAKIERLQVEQDAEVERLKALLGKVRPAVASLCGTRDPLTLEVDAALDSSTPAPRMFTEEQVREAWRTNYTSSRTEAEFLKALLEGAAS